MGIRKAILNEVRKQGFEEGFKIGLEQVRKERMKVSIKKMLQKGKLSVQEIAEILDVELDFVKQVQKDLA